MDRGIRPVAVASVVGLVLVVLMAAASPAGAAFPGRNGLLVVQPATGNGLILVGADGANQRQICAGGAQCSGVTAPVWSPDGTEIAAQGDGPYVIYPDGSCLSCPVPTVWLGSDFETAWDPGVGPGFLSGGRLAVAVDGGYPETPQLGSISTDGVGFKPFKTSRSWQQPAWSSTGRLAAVRRVKRRSEVFVIDPKTGAARLLTRNGASSPNWSPDGRRLAVVHRGWIELIGSHGGRIRRLTRGRAPAWAPNGKQLAFVGFGQRLFVIAARGGRPRPVGHIRADRVDWQPVIGKSPSPCQAPAGSSVLASTPDATVAIDPAPVYQFPDSGAPVFSVLGCLMSDGRQRLIESMPPSNPDDVFGVGPVQVAGDYAALVNESVDEHYGGSTDVVAVYALPTGAAVAARGGETVGCPGYDGYACSSGIDQLVLGADAVTAAHTFTITYGSSGAFGTTVEQIVANDSTGTHVLDSISTTGIYNPAQPLLSQLTLSRDTLTWNHAGTPRSAQLN